MDPRGRRRCPAWRASAVHIEWWRPPGALPSRMRDHGGDAVPPDVRFAGKPCDQKSSALDDEAAARRSDLKEPAMKWLTNEPSCEAGHMTAADQIVTASTNLWTRGRRPHTNI